MHTILIIEIHHFLDLPLLFGYFQHLILILNTFLQFLADRKLKGALKNIAKVKSKDDCVKYYMELCESKVSVTMVSLSGIALLPLSCCLIVIILPSGVKLTIDSCDPVSL